jgi:hypothetical protein
MLSSYCVCARNADVEPVLHTKGLSSYCEFGYESASALTASPALRHSSLSNVRTPTSSHASSSSAASASIGHAFAKTRNWNSEFQVLWYVVCVCVCVCVFVCVLCSPHITSHRARTRAQVESSEALSVSDLYEIRREMGELQSQFVADASATARVLITEVALPPHAKSIRAIAFGGVAGGLKFAHNGVFFKFAVDEHGIYGGNECAQKAAKHELRGLQLLQQLVIDKRIDSSSAGDMRFPLLCVVDWRGYRVLCSTTLPIDRTTIVHGTADGTRVRCVVS